MLWSAETVLHRELYLRSVLTRMRPMCVVTYLSTGIENTGSRTCWQDAPRHATATRKGTDTSIFTTHSHSRFFPVTTASAAYAGVLCRLTCICMIGGATLKPGRLPVAWHNSLLGIAGRQHRMWRNTALVHIYLEGISAASAGGVQLAWLLQSAVARLICSVQVKR